MQCKSRAHLSQSAVGFQFQPYLWMTSVSGDASFCLNNHQKQCADLHGTCVHTHGPASRVACVGSISGFDSVIHTCVWHMLSWHLMAWQLSPSGASAETSRKPAGKDCTCVQYAFRKSCVTHSCVPQSLQDCSCITVSIEGCLRIQDWVKSAEHIWNALCPCILKSSIPLNVLFSRRNGNHVVSLQFMFHAVSSAFQNASRNMNCSCSANSWAALIVCVSSSHKDCIASCCQYACSWSNKIESSTNLASHHWIRARSCARSCLLSLARRGVASSSDFVRTLLALSLLKTFSMQPYTLAPCVCKQQTSCTVAVCGLASDVADVMGLGKTDVSK